MNSDAVRKPFDALTSRDFYALLQHAMPSLPNDMVSLNIRLEPDKPVAVDCRVLLRDEEGKVIGDILRPYVLKPAP